MKYTLDFKSLNTLHYSYIRPCLEDASEVWNGCTERDSDRLEKVQLTAARVVTVMPLYSSRQSLYIDTGWELLSTRRKNKRLCLMYKNINDSVPSYLSHLFPGYVGNRNPYNLRNTTDIALPRVRLVCFQASFFPNTIKQWNELRHDFQNSSSLTSFKNQLRPKKENKNLISQYINNRKYEILIRRLRHRCSALNSNLYHANLVNSPTCICGMGPETVTHYFFECRRFTVAREDLIKTLRP